MIPALDTINGAYQRLRRGPELEKELARYEGREYHVPVLDLEAEQQLRQRADYEELLIEFYCTPESNDTDLKMGDIVYEISEVTMLEESGMMYGLRRALDRTPFDAQIQFTLDFAVSTPDSINRVLDYPLFNENEAKFWREFGGDQWLFQHEWSEGRSVTSMLGMLNQSLAAVWNEPQTVEEVVQRGVAWKIYNQKRERWR